jgi:hypothetical protein
MPTHVYQNWDTRPSDTVDQIEPYRKYYFICEGANTETFYFKKLIDLKKQLHIHPLLDLMLLEKTGEDHNLSFPRHLIQFAEQQKEHLGDDFDKSRDKMVIIFDGDIFEEKVSGYEELIASAEGEEENIIGVSNPNFELFLLLHFEDSYEDYISGHERLFLQQDCKNKYSYASNCLFEKTGQNAKRNPESGNLAQFVRTAIIQETRINQDIHTLHGQVSSNIGQIINSIIQENPQI